MNFVEWSESTVDYGKKLVNSAVEGALDGEKDFLREEPLTPYLEQSARLAVRPAILGACLGILGGCAGSSRRSPAKALACGVLGGAIGFGAGMLWESRDLTAKVAANAWKRVTQTRDEHWFERNPIDYA